MEKSPRYSRATQPSTSASLKPSWSGYELSDTENDWHESPWHESNDKNGALGKTMMLRNTSPMRISRRHSSRFEYEVLSPAKGSAASPARRRHSSTKSPYKPTRDDGKALSPLPGFAFRRNVSPLSRAEDQTHKSPYKSGVEERNLDKNDFVGSSRKQNRRTPTREGTGAHPQLVEVNRVSDKTNHRRRSATAPRLRVKEEDPKKDYGNPSPFSKATSIGELNEIIAKAKLSSDHKGNTLIIDSIGSISPGDIFFSRDHKALALQKKVLPKNNGFERNLTSPKPNILLSPRDAITRPRLRATNNFDHNARDTSSRNGLSQTTMTFTSAMSGKNSGKLSNKSSQMSDTSGRTSGSMQKFRDNRRKSQTDAWFACIRKGSCTKSKSPERRAVDEASFIEKAFVIETLRQFWGYKHQPGSLNGFTCHKQEAQLLQQIVSHGPCPNILFKGPSGSGKRALTMALLREIYGEACWNLSHDLRCFPIQERRPTQVVVPLTSSPHHAELNLNLEANAKYALMGLVKDISSRYAITPEVSNVNFKPDYKVIVLYEVDKAAENLQHLIKWIMDCYTDACKLILCCEDDVEILESVKNRCKVIKVDAPVTHEIMEVLLQIARKENFDLPKSFAAKIATKSKQNLRKAIMALEACKAHNYPFVDDQPIPFGWEEVLVELSADIIVDPSPARLYLIRGKLQKLLLDFVHPNLILQKIVEQFLKRVEGSTKRELYYWHAYYSKKLPTGTTALLKLEEFVAKFMSIYRKSSNNRQYV